VPGLADRLRTVELGDFPSPVVPLPAGEGIASEVGFIKRDDVCSKVYGGNKVRTLEALFGHALARGARRVVAVGAFGSNHSVATALHAPHVGLEPAAILFPQPYSWAALENLRVSACQLSAVMALRHWVGVPLSMWRYPDRDRDGGAYVMPPGGANPTGALGYVSAALELGMQVQRSELPAPATIVAGVGSTCTGAGLLLGLALAVRLGIGFVKVPQLHLVRVTPWPITGRFRVLSLAQRTAQLLASLTGGDVAELPRRELSEALSITSEFLGAGYGVASRQGLFAIRYWESLGLPRLDTTYSSKAAAGFLQRCRQASGPTLFWSTKSSVPLPEVDQARLAAAPPGLQDWIRRAEAQLSAELPADYVRLRAGPKP
jgi:1-aminocyclopropane-1-carboxylate deaminase/D-cysteine desulfhydrase-like pyridoxal-dependent ACC family enzyme